MLAVLVATSSQIVLESKSFQLQRSSKNHSFSRRLSHFDVHRDDGDDLLHSRLSASEGVHEHHLRHSLFPHDPIHLRLPIALLPHKLERHQLGNS